MSSKNKSLSDIAYEYILSRIISFDLKPSDAIIENELCEELRISRTPLREALRRLEAEGYVTKVPKRGTFVRNYTQEDITDNCDIRIIFELYCIKSCIEEVTRKEITEVREMLMALDINSPSEEYYKSDDALHGMIAKYCRNAKIRSMLRNLEVQLEFMQKISAQTPNRLYKSREEHLDIIDALERGDLKKAEDALRSHLENVKESCVINFQRMRVEKLGM